MRNTATLIMLLSLLAGTARAQPGFNRIYSFGLPTNNFSRFLAADDIIYCIGTAYDPNISPSPQQVLMVKMDTLGNVLHSALYKDSLNHHLSMYFLWGNIIKTSEGRFAFMTTALNRGGRLLIQIDGDLQVRSIFEYSNGGNLSMFEHQIMEADDGGFYIVGNVTRPNYKRDGFIRRVSKEGTELWFKYYGDYNKDEAFLSMTKISDNRFLIGGGAGPDANNHETARAGLWVLDSNGTVLKTWLGPEEPDLMSILGLLSSSDGGFIAHGRTYWGEGQWGSKVQVSLLKFDSTLSLQWLKHIGPGSSDYNGIYDMTRTPDGHYLVAGQRTAYGDLTQPSGGDWGGWLYKFTEQGDSLWSRADNAPAPHVPGGQFAYGGVGILSSGSVVAGGEGYIDGKFVGWVVKVTADGCMDTIFCSAVGAGEPPSRVLDASLLSIAPNPAGATVSLALEGEAAGDRPVRFSIHNLLGQELWSAQSASGREEVWLSGWPAGAYIARAESARGVAARVFVKE